MLYKKLLFLVSLVSINAVVVASDHGEETASGYVPSLEAMMKMFELLKAVEECEEGGALSAQVNGLEEIAVTLSMNAENEALYKRFKKEFPHLKVSPGKVVRAMLDGLKDKSEQELRALRSDWHPGKNPVEVTTEFALECLRIQDEFLKEQANQ